MSSAPEQEVPGRLLVALLTDEMSAEVFQTQIVSKMLAHGVPQQEPVVVFVSGQPGAGKTDTTKSIKRHLDARGGSIVVDSDRYKPFHPQYAALMAKDDRTAAPYTSMDGRRWMAAAEQWLIGRRVDVIVETTMRDPGDFIDPAKMFRDAGYRVEAAILAVPEAQSRLGVVLRYHEQVEKMTRGRLTPQANHDASYVGVLASATHIDHNRAVDVVTVYRRGNEQLHINCLAGDGNWRWPACARRAIEAERHRAWTPPETSEFVGRINTLAEKMGPQWHAELAGIAKLARPVAAPQHIDRTTPVVITQATRTPAVTRIHDQQPRGHAGR